MFISPLPDGGAGWAMFFAMIGAGAWAISAVIIEAIVFSMGLRVKLAEASGLSIVVNLVTTIIGYAYATLQYESVLKYFYGGDSPFPTNFWLTIAALFVVSILLEGIFLIGMKPKVSKSDIWATAIGANIFSYVVGIGIMVAIVP